MDENKFENTEVEQSKKRLRTSRNILLLCNFFAALLVFSIYFHFQNFIFIVLAGILLLVNIPAFILFKKIESDIK